MKLSPGVATAVPNDMSLVARLVAGGLANASPDGGRDGNSVSVSAVDNLPSWLAVNSADAGVETSGCPPGLATTSLNGRSERSVDVSGVLLPSPTVDNSLLCAEGKSAQTVFCLCLQVELTSNSGGLSGSSC